MNHKFSIEIAKKVGLKEAVLLDNLAFWMLKNKASERHFYDGHYWTYNSINSFAELFPYWTAKQIRTIIKNLEKKDIIKSGNYNKNSYDRTKWYTIINFSILQYYQIHLPERENGNVKKGEPIPDIKPDIKTNKKPYIVAKSVFEFWNSLSIVKQRDFEEYKKDISGRLELYSVDEIKQAMKNYNMVLSDDKCYWSYKWTLSEFLQRRNWLDKFIPDNFDIKQFYKKNKSNMDKPKRVSSNVKGGLFSEYDEEV